MAGLAAMNDRASVFADPRLGGPASGDFSIDPAGPAAGLSCVCGLSAGASRGAGGGPGDRDGDGVADGNDNCPLWPNPDQGDADRDGAGDVCDECPDTPAGRITDARGCLMPPDLDGDGDVDQEDFGLFQRCHSGANVYADPACLK